MVLRYESRPDEGEEEGELGGPAIMERDWGAGRVFQFSSTADIDWSDLAIRGPSVVPLLYRIIGNIQANRDSGLNLRVGEPFRKVLAANEQNKEGLVFDKGAVQSKTLTPETIGAATVLQYPDTHRAGVYRFSIGQHGDQFICRTVDQRESDLFKIEDGDLPADAQLIKWENDANLRQGTGSPCGCRILAGDFVDRVGLGGVETFAQKFSQSNNERLDSQINRKHGEAGSEVVGYGVKLPAALTWGYIALLAVLLTTVVILSYRWMPLNKHRPQGDSGVSATDHHNPVAWHSTAAGVDVGNGTPDS